MWNGTDEDSLFYTVYIWRGNDRAEQYALYLMNGFFDPSAGKLTADGTCTLFTRNASGEYDSRDDGESVEAIFSVLENGTGPVRGKVKNISLPTRIQIQQTTKGL